MIVANKDCRAGHWHGSLLAAGAVLLIIGLYFVIGGAYLWAIGGTPYYLLVGVGLLVTAVMLMLRRGISLWVYAVVLLGTLVWVVIDGDIERVALAPRLWLPTAVGVYLLMPWVAHRLNEHRGAYGLGLVVAASIAVCSVPGFIPRSGPGSATARSFTPAPTLLMSGGGQIYYVRTPRAQRTHAMHSRPNHA